MNLRQLELLRTVIRCETTMSAARELALSQPAVSNAIKHMEAQVGFALFTRHNNRLFPTAEAMTLYAESEPLFEMHSSLNSRIADMRERRTGHLKVCATPPIGDVALPLALTNFMHRHRNLRTHLDICDSLRVADAVHNGVAELGFLLSTGELCSSLKTEMLIRSQMVCVLPANHRLTALASLSPSDLKDVPLITSARDTRFGKAVRNAFDQANEEMSYCVEVRYCNTACSLVEQGLGVAIIDPFSARAARHSAVEIRAFEPAIDVQAHVVFSERQPLSRLARFFIDEIRAVLGDVASTQTLTTVAA